VTVILKESKTKMESKWFNFTYCRVKCILQVVYSILCLGRRNFTVLYKKVFYTNIWAPLFLDSVKINALYFYIRLNKYRFKQLNCMLPFYIVSWKWSIRQSYVTRWLLIASLKFWQVCCQALFMVSVARKMC
jgi:hypothetical protein